MTIARLILRLRMKSGRPSPPHSPQSTKGEHTFENGESASKNEVDSMKVFDTVKEEAT